VAARVQQRNLDLLPPADLAGEIDLLRDDLRNERDRNLRTLADFKNYRRRVEREGNKLAEEGKLTIFLPLLEIIDDMEKALHSVGNEKQPFAEGVRLIHHKLLALLEAHGVLPFESVGTAFDHNRHEAVAMADHDEREPGTVVDELRRGYLWNNEILRPAQVRVAGQ
jgi:molecular chaperone GrpE